MKTIKLFSANDNYTLTANVSTTCDVFSASVVIKFRSDGEIFSRMLRKELGKVRMTKTSYLEYTTRFESSSASELKAELDSFATSFAHSVLESMIAAQAREHELDVVFGA